MTTIRYDQIKSTSTLPVKATLSLLDKFVIEDSEDNDNHKSFAFQTMLRDQFTTIPVTPTSTGLRGQLAWDDSNNLMYICVADNVWVRFTVTDTW